MKKNWLFLIAEEQRSLNREKFVLERIPFSREFQSLIIKITISSNVIGLKNSYFPLIHSPSCYRTVCYRTVCYGTVQQTNHIQSCSLNQPITTLVSITIETLHKLL